MKEFKLNTNSEIVLKHMNFIIDNSNDIFKSFDIHEIQIPNREIFTKHYDHLDRSSVRIIVEKIDGVLEVKTMHYKKYKKLITED